MSHHKTGTARNQMSFGTLDDQIGADNPVRIIDAFVDMLAPLALPINQRTVLLVTSLSRNHALVTASARRVQDTPDPLQSNPCRRHITVVVPYFIQHPHIKDFLSSWRFSSEITYSVHDLRQTT